MKRGPKTKVTKQVNFNRFFKAPFLNSITENYIFNRYLGALIMYKIPLNSL